MESGYRMEAPRVTQFRYSVLKGRWSEAEACLPMMGVHDPHILQVSDTDRSCTNLESYMLILVDCALFDKPAEVFRVIRGAEYHRSFTGSKSRTGTTEYRCWKITFFINVSTVLWTCPIPVPWFFNRFIMCSTAEDLKRRANWDGANGGSRQELLSELQSMSQSHCHSLTSTF